MPESMSFLTWNLAMLARSNQAPPSWGQEHTEFAVRQRVLELEPDLVLFQELPRLVPYVDTHDMVKANPESHQGNLATLVSHELLATLGPPDVQVVAGCAVLITFGAAGITVTNVHLAPGPGPQAMAERLEQFARIVEASPTPDLAIIGDTNTRTDELDALAAAGLHTIKPPRATWNSRRNRFNRRGAEFTAYFTRAFATAGLRVERQRTHDDGEDVDGHRFHLSDHFPLSGRLAESQG